MRERYLHAILHSKILFLKKLLNEIRKESLDKFMVATTKELLAVLKMR
jgi:hypothetical protein